MTEAGGFTVFTDGAVLLLPYIVIHACIVPDFYLFLYSFRSFFQQFISIFHSAWKMMSSCWCGINFGMMLVQSVVNTFGSEVLAGYSASIRIDNIVTVPLSAVGNAMSPYTAQNSGAGKNERIDTGWKSALAIILSFAEALQHTGRGEENLSYLGWFYGILGFAFVTGGVLRGMGKMASFTVALFSPVPRRYQEKERSYICRSMI